MVTFGFLLFTVSLFALFVIFDMLVYETTLLRSFYYLLMYDTGPYRTVLNIFAFVALFICVFEDRKHRKKKKK
ncbi:hypothetical protein [Alkalihalobacterium bogoriense]|uniref:hypothetical protein n=1 Tax=Alkalihalobacterium bogoriense TaxID=246272 RepID=UPI00047DC34D|nr:hypothetical protein [Alkalihalobacterium bogoriense]